MWSSPRSGARFNRACVRRALASLSTTAMLFLQHGGVNPAGRPLSSMALSGALRAADSASRISPSSFDGDKRGRMRQFCDAVAFDQKFLWSDASLRLLADPRATPHLGLNLPLGARTSPACPVVADRKRMPRKAAAVPLDDWLPPCLVSAWNHPECEASSAPRYFDVNMAEWRALCRRMLRSGLGKKVLPTSSPSHLSGGASSVPKDLDRDRFIGDRQPRNGTERLIGRCHLPWDPPLRRLMLASDCVIRMHLRDVSDCYYAKSVDEERLQRQVLGPRVPVSWFRNLEDTSLDLLPLEGFEPWVSSDLVQNPIQETVDPRRYCQISRGSGHLG